MKCNSGFGFCPYSIDSNKTDTFKQRTTGYHLSLCFAHCSIPAKPTNTVPHADSILGDFELHQNSIFIVVVFQKRGRVSTCSNLTDRAHFSANTTSAVGKEHGTYFCVSISHSYPLILICREPLNITSAQCIDVPIWFP